jgi:hypothetical protein
MLINIIIQLFNNLEILRNLISIIIINNKKNLIIHLLKVKIKKFRKLENNYLINNIII